VETRANYFMVGLFVLGLTATLLAVVFWFLRGQHVERTTYLVYLNESVSGLSVQAPVRFNGVDIGYVSDISLNPKNPQQIRLELKIDDDTPINQSTTAVLQTQGVTGVMFIGLQAGAVNAPPLQQLPNEEYLVIASKTSLLMQVDTVVRELAASFKGVGGNISELLNAKNQVAIQKSLANLATITDALASQSGDIKHSVKDMAVTAQETRVLLERFSQQVVPSMTQTFDQLTRVLNELEPTVRNLKTNPSMLVRGTVPATPGPGE